jgi:hypothetical protein
MSCRQAAILSLLVLILSSCKLNSSPQQSYKRDIPKALLATNYSSLDDLKQEVVITYGAETNKGDTVTSYVTLEYSKDGLTIEDKLMSGISQQEIMEIKNGSILDKLQFIIEQPFAVRSRFHFTNIFELARRIEYKYGVGDIAFYFLAEECVNRISFNERVQKRAKDLGEKGYLNTFNHIMAQAFITAIYSEKHAEYIADVHERMNMPELTTGKFTEEQLKDSINYPVDNYVDMINNEIGQELGKVLKHKYIINEETNWSPELLTHFLNDLIRYYSDSFSVRIKPFKVDETLVIKFSKKLNIVLKKEANHI